MTENVQIWAESIDRFRESLKKDGTPAIWEPKFLKACQDNGMNITPSNFYSPIPMFSEIDEHYETNGGKQIYNHPSVFDSEAIESYFSNLTPFKKELLNNKTVKRDELSKNGMFSHSDAMAYYCMVRYLKPKNIVEIGSGYSTLFASMASNKNKVNSSITAYEPFPSDFLKSQKNISLIQKKAQEITPDELNAILTDGDILFVDSTHTVKEGSDVIHIIARLLPFLEKKVFIHFHDIFLPYIFPKNKLLRMQFWEEQYLLYAFLLDNPKAKVLFGSVYNQMNFNEAMSDFTISEKPGGGSLWFEYN